MCSRDAGMNSDSVTSGRLEDHTRLDMFHYPSKPLRSKVEPVSLRSGSLGKGNEGRGEYEAPPAGHPEPLTLFSLSPSRTAS